MKRTLPLYLLAALALAPLAAHAELAGEERLTSDSTAALLAQVPTVTPAVLELPPAAPGLFAAPALAPVEVTLAEPGVVDLAELAVHLAVTRQWGLLSIPVGILLVWVAREFGGRVLPVLRTPAAGAVLSVASGLGSALLPAALGLAPLSLGLLLSGLVTAIVNSGLFGIGKGLRKGLRKGTLARADAAGAAARAAVKTDEDILRSLEGG